MRFEIPFFIIIGFVIYNIYTDGKAWKQLLSYTKYYKMAGIGIGALLFYWLFKHQPDRAYELVNTTNEYLKYAPLDKSTTSILSPMLDFTSKFSGGGGGGGGNGSRWGGGGGGGSSGGFMGDIERNSHRMFRSAPPPAPAGGDGTTPPTKTKRSVSETKKKYVASNQNWRCGDCNHQLSAWYEIDHKIRLEYGGSNEIDNLVALCRECHGKKTTMENL